MLKPSKNRDLSDAEEGDINFSFYSDDEVDCASVVEEVLVLALPYTALCSDDCKGLCAQCGCNLNTSKCKCEPPKIKDERFAALEQIKLH